MHQILQQKEQEGEQKVGAGRQKDSLLAGDTKRSKNPESSRMLG